MFARFLDMTVKPDKKAELFRKVREEVLPILNKHAGFIDVMPMEAEIEPTKVYLVSLWHQKVDAEKYEEHDFARVEAIYKPFLTMPIIVKLCKVDETVFKKAITVAA